MRAITTVIIDDHQLFADGLRSLLGHSTSFEVEVLGASGHVEDMMILIDREQPHLIFLDLNLGKHNGLHLIDPIKKKSPDSRIIVLSGYGETKFIRTAFKEGIDGYILKGSGLPELEKGIRQVLEGELFFGEGVKLDPRHQKNLTDHNNTPYLDSFIMKHKLTKREVEVLSLITRAFSNKEIGHKLYISDQTVSVHRKNLMRKLGVSNTVSLIKLAQKMDLP